MTLTIPKELKSAVAAVVAYHKEQGQAIDDKAALLMLAQKGVEASSAPAAHPAHPARLAVAAPTAAEVDALCVEENLRPATKGLGFVLNLREDCEHWKDRVRALYVEEPVPKTMALA